MFLLGFLCPYDVIWFKITTTATTATTARTTAATSTATAATTARTTAATSTAETTTAAADAERWQLNSFYLVQSFALKEP